MVGFAVTLVAVLLYSGFTLRQVASLRQLQSEIVERNRRDSLLLLQIQGTLNSLGLALHDALEEPYSVADFEPEFDRLLGTLSDGITKEGSIAPEPRQSAKRQQLSSQLIRLDQDMHHAFEAARAGRTQEARAWFRNQLTLDHKALTGSVARMLVENNNLDEQTELQIARIYDRVERDIYSFLALTVAAIGITGFALVASSRRIFRHLENLSDQKSVLARKLISVQEEVLRSVSRELHDEFGQILTAIGAMLARLERKGIPPDSPVRGDLNEVREITQDALDKVRSLSQILHPAVIDDYGLEKAVEWYVPMFEKQTGIRVDYKKTGSGPGIKDETAIHVYRILQEALNNVAKHSGVKRATLRVDYTPGRLTLQVEDRGHGLKDHGSDRRGLGLVAMRERAELVHGRLNLESVPQGGTRVSLEVPITQSVQSQ